MVIVWNGRLQCLDVAVFVQGADAVCQLRMMIFGRCGAQHPLHYQIYADRQRLLPVDHLQLIVVDDVPERFASPGRSPHDKVAAGDAEESGR